MLYDEILDQIGGWGRYQKTVCFLLAISAIPIGYFTMTPVFTLKTPEHRCRIPNVDDDVTNYSKSLYDAEGLEIYIPWDTENDRYRRCEMFDISSSSDNSSVCRCQFGYVYDGRLGEVTAVSEWNLVCNQSYVKPRVTSIFMAGVLCGSLFSGFLADRFGRRPVLVGAMFFQFIFIGFNIFNVSPEMFAVFMFLSGSCTMASFVTSVVLATELVDTERRAFVETIIMLGFSFGYVILPLCAYFVLLWRQILLIGGLSGILFIPYWWLIPESPRNLITSGRFTEARDLLLKIAQKNGTRQGMESAFADESFRLIAEECTERKIDAKDGCLPNIQVPYVDLFIKPGIISKTLCSCFSWFVISLTYVTLNLNSGNLGGDEFINCFISAAIEFPAYSGVYFLLRTKGRRYIMVMFMGIAALSCIATPIIMKVSITGAIVSAMTGKFFVTCVFSVVYLFTVELFPTVGRNQAVGMCSTCARIGSVIAPYIIYLGETGSQEVPYFIIGSLAITAAFANMLLPETQGRNLPDTYEEAEALQRKCCLFGGSRKSIPVEIEIQLDNKPSQE